MVPVKSTSSAASHYTGITLTSTQTVTFESALNVITYACQTTVSVPLTKKVTFFASEDKKLKLNDFLKKATAIFATLTAAQFKQFYLEVTSMMSNMQGGKKETLKFCEKGMALDPKDESFWIKYYENAKNFQTVKEVTEFLRKACIAHPQSLLLNSAWMEHEAIVTGIERAREIAAPFVSNQKFELRLAMCEIRHGDLRKARFIFTSQIERKIATFDVYDEFMHMEYVEGNVDRALKLGKAAINPYLSGESTVSIPNGFAKSYYEIMARHGSPADVDALYNLLVKHGYKESRSQLGMVKFDSMLKIGNLWGARSHLEKLIPVETNPRLLGCLKLRLAKLEALQNNKAKVASVCAEVRGLWKKDVFKADLYEGALLEMMGDVNGARVLFHRATVNCPDLKIWKDAIFFELRHKNRDGALLLSESSIRAVPESGRLRQIYLELIRGIVPELEIHDRYFEALEELPKSGELWQSLSGMYLNPLSQFYSLEKAEVALRKAVTLTPQNGDGHIELIRLLLIKKMTPSQILAEVKKSTHRFTREACYGFQWSFCFDKENPTFDATVRNAIAIVRERMERYSETYKSHTAFQDSDYLDLLSATGHYTGRWTKELVGKKYDHYQSEIEHTVGL